MKNEISNGENVKNMSLSELEDFFISIDEPSYRAKQLIEWIYGRRETSYEKMTNFPAYLRDVLYKKAPLFKPKVVKTLKSADTVKSLIECRDGENVETVTMYHDYGISQCVSSQAGCAMRCTFCASGSFGLVRNLDTSEMIDQMLCVDDRISSVVIMGMGEPLANYDAVLKFVKLLNNSKGFNIGFRHITISTCGLVKEIKRLCEEKLQLTLSLSLHAADNETRSQLMPINDVYPIEQVVGACKDYAEYTGRRVTYEYILLKGVNDRSKDAVNLVNLLKGSLAHVNLIPYNPVETSYYERSEPSVIKAFARTLNESGIETTVRREHGVSIDAACGQLRITHKQDERK